MIVKWPIGAVKWPTAAVDNALLKSLTRYGVERKICLVQDVQREKKNDEVHNSFILARKMLAMPCTEHVGVLCALASDAAAEAATTTAVAAATAAAAETAAPGRTLVNFLAQR